MRIEKTNPKDISRKFEDFVSIVEKRARKNKDISIPEFKYNVQEFGDQFVSANALPRFNKTAQRLAETLIGLNNDRLAGIIYSTLIKLNRNTDAKFVEDIATKALAIARRKHDPVHIAARTNDLKEIYKLSEYGSDKHLKTLKEEKRALSEICKNYKSAKSRFETIARQMRPIEKYQEMLAAIRLEIAEVLIKRGEELPLAKEELLASKAFYDQFEEGHNAKKIVAILKKLEG